MLKLQMIIVLVCFSSVFTKENDVPKVEKCLSPVVCVDSNGNAKPSWQQSYIPDSDDKPQCTASKPGPKGEKGEPGTDDKNVEKGSLGPKGNAGINGTNGAPGIKGPKGDKGDDANHKILREAAYAMSDGEQYYNGLLFLPLISKKLERNPASDVCQRFGGELANIYNKEHMDQIMKYIRNNKMGNKSLIYFHLGMTFNTTTKKLYTDDGIEVPKRSLKWRRNHPNNQTNAVTMGLLVDADESSTEQYVYNNPDYPRYPLCEIDE